MIGRGDEGEAGRERLWPGPGKRLYPTKAVAKANPRRATSKDRSGKERESNGHRALEFIRKNPGATYEQFLAAKLRPADLRWDVKLGRVEVRA